MVQEKIAVTDTKPLNQDLSPPPRCLSLRTRAALILGHPLALLGALCFTLGALVVWFLIAGYGLGFSQIRSLKQASQTLPGIVETSERLRIWTGEPIHQITARFEVGGKSFRAAGFRPDDVTVSPGAAIGVVVPTGMPHEAWVQGYQKFPVQIVFLLKITIGLLSPGCLLLLWGLLLGFRQRRLAENGVAVTAERVRKWALPRPMISYDVERWSYTDKNGKMHRVWAFGREMKPADFMLVSPQRFGGAMPQNRLLPNHEVVDAKVEGVSVARRRMSLAVCLLFSLQGLMIFLFLWT